MERFFPQGWEHYLAGGLTIGVGVSLIFLLVGIRAGASGVLTSSLGLVSRLPVFRSSEYVAERGWRLAFTLGLVLGAAAYALAFVGSAFVTEVQWWRLLAGGLLVGFGTRLSRGCTSGHGICGMASLSKPSILAVVVFLAVGIGTAHVVRLLGVAP